MSINCTLSIVHCQLIPRVVFEVFIHAEHFPHLRCGKMLFLKRLSLLNQCFQIVCELFRGFVMSGDRRVPVCGIPVRTLLNVKSQR